MKLLQRIAISVALLAVLVGGGVAASAQGGRQRALSGLVERIDLSARTIDVREQGTNQLITVRVPEGALVKTTSTSQPYVVIERLIPGMHIVSLTVK